MDAPRWERRHHRKAAAAGVAGGGSGGAAAARAAYGDVFGGPPRFAAPFRGAPVDYAEVFGGVATTCSIPFLDLPPVASVGGDDGFFGCGVGHYGEIFGRFDFGDFAVPYEELFGDAEAEGERGAEEIASSSGSSRSSIKNESSQLDAGPSILPQHFKEHQSSSISFPPESQQFVMSYNKTTQGRPDDRVQMTTCTVDSLMDYVVGSCNFSHVPATNHVSRVDNGTMANGDNGKKSPPISASANVRSPESDFIVDQKQHIPASPPRSENVSVNENNENSDSHSTPSNGTPTDYPFLRVSDVNVQTQLEVPPPPLRQQPKLHKGDSAAKGDVHLVNHSCTPTSSVRTTLSTNMPQAERRADTEANPSSAAAAMKEAMEYAEARLRAAKELLERKGDSFKLRKKPSHHRSTRSTEIKAPVEVDTFEEKLSVEKPAKEEKNSEDSLLSKHQKVSAARLDNCDDSGKRVLPFGNPQQMMQCCTEPCQTSSKLEKLSNWRSGDEFYELTGDDQKCKTDTATGKEVNCFRTNHDTKLSKDQKGRTEVSAADSDLERYEKLWEVNDSKDVGVKHVNLREENTGSMEKGGVSIIQEASTENVAHKEFHHSHFEGPMTLGNSKESHDDVESVELLYMNEISSKPDFIKDMCSSFSEVSSSGNHANDLIDLSNSSMRLSPVAGTSQEPKNRKVGLEAACYYEMKCTSGSSKKLQEPPDVANVDNSQSSQIKSLILEELEGSDVNQAFPRGLSTTEPELKGSYASQAFPRAESEAETYGREKFSFIDESFMHNENDKIIEVPSKALISEVEKAGTEEEVGPCAHSEETVPDQDAVCPEEESDITSRNNNLADHEESNMQNVFEVASKLIKRDLAQEIQGSLGPSEVESRTEEGTDGLVSDCKGKEAEKTPSENSEKTGTKEGSAHGNQEGQTASETDTNKVQSDVDAQGNITDDEMGSVIRSEDEVTIKTANDCPTRISKDEPASCSEMCTGMQHLPQNAGSAASQTTNKSVPSVEKIEEVSKEAERELPTERSTTFEEEKNRVNKMVGKDSRERISKAELKHQQSHLEKSGSLPRYTEGPIPVSPEVSRKEAPGVQRTKERGTITKAERDREKDKEASRRPEEAKERERRFEKERENAEERERKNLEEQERAREREKDRLAVERATREAHERPFAEVRERAEKMALESLTAARQRASAEAREKVERASADAIAERAAREARIKAERAAVERATAEARERAIEKAKAEKAAADIKERKERYRSSFKESFKSTNLNIRQDTQFQRATSSSFARNPDSSSKVVEVESALRHKARLERHQRTAERVTKALAEKSMRDLLAQREQAEKHRMAEFLDPEVKRWSNGKEGNLRALLSTLQYILGADSGWQPVPLTELITAAAVKKSYRKATLCVHPDKLQQRGATIRQKYICEKVFDLLKDAWNKFTSEER